MLDFGFIITIIGGIMLVWHKLSAKAETRALSPRSVLLRTSAVESIRESKKRGYVEGYVLIAIGIIIILITGVAN